MVSRARGTQSKSQQVRFGPKLLTPPHLICRPTLFEVDRELRSLFCNHRGKPVHPMRPSLPVLAWIATDTLVTVLLHESIIVQCVKWQALVSVAAIVFL